MRVKQNGELSCGVILCLSLTLFDAWFYSVILISSVNSAYYCQQGSVCSEHRYDRLNYKLGMMLSHIVDFFEFCDYSCYRSFMEGASEPLFWVMWDFALGIIFSCLFLINDLLREKVRCISFYPDPTFKKALKCVRVLWASHPIYHP